MDPVWHVLVTRSLVNLFIVSSKQDTRKTKNTNIHVLGFYLPGCIGPRHTCIVDDPLIFQVIIIFNTMCGLFLGSTSSNNHVIE